MRREGYKPKTPHFHVWGIDILIFLRVGTIPNDWTNPNPFFATNITNSYVLFRAFVRVKMGQKYYSKFFAKHIRTFQNVCVCLQCKNNKNMDIINGFISPFNWKHISCLNEKGLELYPSDEGFYEYLSAYGVTLETFFRNPLQYAEAYLVNLVKQEILLFFEEQGKQFATLEIQTDGSRFSVYSVDADDETQNELYELLS